MKYRPDQITRFGFEPYAVYGGYVYSFKYPSVSGDRIYDAAMLDKIFKAAHKQANEIVAERNAANLAAQNPEGWRKVDGVKLPLITWSEG